MRNCMIYSMYMIGHFQFALKSAFMEIFQKPPGGPPRGTYTFGSYLGSCNGTAWRHLPGCQATHGTVPRFGIFWVKVLAVLVELLGDSSLWLDLCFSLSFYMSLLVGKQGLGLRRRSSVGFH